MSHILKTTVYLTDVKDVADMNEIYGKAFSGNLPVRTTVVVSALPRPELRIEIEAVAAIE